MTVPAKQRPADDAPGRSRASRAGSDSRRAFRLALGRTRRIWQSGLALRQMLWLVGQALMVMIVAVALDRLLALEPRWRIGLTVAAGLVWGTLWLLRLGAILRLSPRQAACRVDRRLADRRQTVLSGWELARKPPQGDSLHAYLTERMIADAHANLQATPARRWFPSRDVLCQGKVLLVQLTLAAIVYLMFPDATRTILARWRYPGRDDPPYSLYRFALEPDRPQVLYGDDLDLAVRISGAPVTQPVQLLIRHGSRIHRNTCFRDEAEDRYAQRIERVIDPVDCAFAIGRARSAWVPVEIQLQPQVAAARLEVRPPAYSRLPLHRFLAGQEALTALAGSRVRLETTSNRPLAGGHLLLRSTRLLGEERMVHGERVASHTIAFEWTLTEGAEIEAVVHDIRGTASAPLRLRQTLRPDRSPAVRLHQPARYAMATPNSILPLEASASDDIGLQRVALVQALAGFRDRIQPLGPDAPDRDFRWKSRLNLAELGVEPGQTLEFSLEARDTNPNLLGIASTDIARVDIISEADYARMMRERATLQAFMARFRLSEQAMREVLNQLEALEHAMAAPDGTGEDRAQLQAQTVAAMRSAEQLYEALANDFPIFDAESSLRQTLEETLEPLRTHRARIDGHTLQPPERLALTARLAREALQPSLHRLADHHREAETIAALARLMEAAGRFMQLYTAQTELARRLERFERAFSDEDLPFLHGLGRRQETLRQDLAGLCAALVEAAADLPEGEVWASWRQSAEAFAESIQTLDIPADMAAAGTAAEGSLGRQAFVLASQARDKMRQLLGDQADSPMGSLCQGKLPCAGQGEGDCPGCSPTLAQMMEAMLRRRRGSGGAGGEGGMGTAGAGWQIGGSTGDGYWLGGSSLIDTPVYGPARLDIETSGPARSAPWEATGTGGAGVGSMRATESASGAIAAEEHDAPRGQARAIAERPPKYREALIHYFSEEKP